MTNKTVFQLANGLIIGTVSSSDPNVSGTIAGWSGQIDGIFDTNTYYVDQTQSPPVAIPRQSLAITLDKTQISANGADAATFLGVPDGVQAVIDTDAPETITDGTLELTATVAGTYTIAFSLFPYVPRSFEVIAV